MDSIGISTYSDCVTDHIIGASAQQWRIRSANSAFLVAVIDTLQEAEDNETTVEWLCDSATLKQLEKDFLVATKASELAADGQLSIRSGTDEAGTTPTLLVSPEKAVSLLPLSGEEVVQTEIVDEEIVSRLWETYDTEWEMGIPESVDTPPYSRLLTLAEHKLGTNVSEDLDDAYAAVGTRAPDNRPEPVTVGLLVGAKHDLLLRDVVEWAETTTLATQGTVSKLKQQLEDVGVVATESENIGVGRPRQRLTLADDTFESLSAGELVANVQSVLV
ncbi:hypothetical protein SAMN05216226_11425 [Halovenus aranensis]|jgi:hypothetical protein|uniref:Uncharacterized protein n=1 Tax=Halovenus aranensis TaxID=890420 RepID=A0A1G8YC71_9EURY|nr:DUF5821 family protein [Halovenus aranensis]SDK00297.1 hypothetical protein SAMN05216226_11425 [Halovenus aranensis]